jgi:two-component system alkaline phosphatase synthesis response regulator PhoP
VVDILIQAKESEAINKLHLELARKGFACSFVYPGNGIAKRITKQFPDLVIVETKGRSATDEIREVSEKVARNRPLPILALASQDALDDNEGYLEADDFITSPYNASELVLRIKRLLRNTPDQKKNGVIEAGDIIIDQDTCEVIIAGRLVMLTFKEYELLRFLASNKGHVFSREVLLGKVWGYDYFGGDRTVDVHVRRLRSKIERFDSQYIETVRNIGYRLKA